MVGKDLLPALEHDPGGLAVLDEDLCDGGLGADLGAQRAGRAGDGRSHATGAALGDAPGPEGAVDLAHVVMQQHVGRARRVDAEVGADDARCAHGALQRRRLEPAVEELGRAHGHQLHEGQLLLSRQGREVLDQGAEPGRVARVGASRVGRGHRQDGLDETGHLRHQLAVFLVGLGVTDRPASQLAHGVSVVVGAPQVVTIDRGEGAVEGQDVEPVARQLQVTDDLRPQQAHHIREHAEAEAGEDLHRERGAAEDLPSLEHEGPEASPREVGTADEAVVAAADDDRVVASWHVLLARRASPAPVDRVPHALGDGWRHRICGHATRCRPCGSGGLASRAMVPADAHKWSARPTFIAVGRGGEAPAHRREVERWDSCPSPWAARPRRHLVPCARPLDRRAWSCSTLVPWPEPIGARAAPSGATGGRVASPAGRA